MALAFGLAPGNPVPREMTLWRRVPPQRLTDDGLGTLRPDSSNFRPSGGVSLEIAEVHESLGSGPEVMLTGRDGAWAVIAVTANAFNDRGYDVLYDPTQDCPAHAYVPTRPSKVHARELAQLSTIVLLAKE